MGVKFKKSILKNKDFSNKIICVYFVLILLISIVPIAGLSDTPQLNITTTTGNDYANIDVTVTDNDGLNISSFIDWNNSLVGYWNFEHNNKSFIFDNSTYNNDAEMIGHRSKNNFTDGRYGQGYYFNGSGGGYLNCGNDPEFNMTDELTLELWFKEFETSFNMSFSNITGNYEDWGYSVDETSDGGYIFAGEGSYQPTVSGSGDIFLSKHDSCGNIQYTASYGTSEEDIAYDVIETNDGKYAATGWVGTGSKDLWFGEYFINTSTNKLELAQPCFLSGGNDFDNGYSVKQAHDGNYVIGGYTKSYGNPSNSDMWLLKLDKSNNLNELINNTFGISSLHEVAYSVCITNDENYTLAGTRNTKQTDIMKIKVNNTDSDNWNSKVIWCNNDTGWSSYDHAWDIIESSPDYGFLVVGFSNWSIYDKRDLFIQKINSAGYNEWNYTYNKLDTNNDCNIAYSADQTRDGGYIVSGHTGDTDNDIYDSSRDLILIKLNPNGGEEWKKIYSISGQQEGRCIKQTSDGGYIVAGFTNNSEEKMEFWLLKTNISGNITNSNNNQGINKTLIGKGRSAYQLELSNGTIKAYLNRFTVGLINTSLYNLSQNWNHLVMTFNTSENKTKLYLNKILTEKSFDCTSILDNDLNLTIGKNFSGIIDEVRIWNRALSHDEINASYNASVYNTNFTNLSTGKYNYSVYAINEQGFENNTNQNVSIIQTRNIYVDKDNREGPWSGSYDNPFQYIQDAINNSSDGDTIYVLPGNYSENIIIDKEIDLIGNETDTTMIWANLQDQPCINISESNVNISFFNLTNANKTAYGAGIYVCNIENVNITHCNIYKNLFNIKIDNSNNVNISYNTIYNSSYDCINICSSDTIKIYNNSIYNSYDDGIHLSNSTYTNITNNKINSSIRYGINLQNISDNNNIYGNTINQNYFDGIKIWDNSDNNNISNNCFYNNIYEDIWIYNSVNNSLYSNTFNNSDNKSVYINNSDYTNIINCTFINNNISIVFDRSNNSEIKYCIFRDNNLSINLTNSMDNTIYTNNISNNSVYGIFLFDSSDNLIYNNFFNNANNAYDNDINNWNRSSIISCSNIINGANLSGNYWNDYNGIDTDFNGIGDTKTPYNSSQDIQNGGDHFPLVYPTEPINTSVNQISPYSVTSSTKDITADGADDLDNLTLYYRHSTVNSSWWNISWSYRKQLDISNNLDDYQIKLIVGNNSGGNITCNGHSQSDFDDIRFVNKTGNELPYWIENYTLYTNATFWINNTYNDSRIWMYYGNENITTTSNGSTTWDFFENYSTNVTSEYPIAFRDSPNTTGVYSRNSWPSDSKRIRYHGKILDIKNDTIGVKLLITSGNFTDPDDNKDYAYLELSTETDDENASITSPGIRSGCTNENTPTNSSFIAGIQNEGIKYYYEINILSDQNVDYKIENETYSSIYENTINSNVPDEELRYQIIQYFWGNNDEEHHLLWNESEEALDIYIYRLDNSNETYINYSLYWYAEGKFNADQPTWSSFGNQEKWMNWNNSGNPDNNHPWSWSFDFPSNTGYYEFYSIGKKSGLPVEQVPHTADASCYYNYDPPNNQGNGGGIPQLPEENNTTNDTIDDTNNTTNDTTAPNIIIITPKNNAEIYDKTPKIKAIYSDNSNINLSSIIFKLDGEIKQARKNNNYVQYIPNSNLSIDSHTVYLKVSDIYGNTNSKTWTFKINQRIYYENKNNTNITKDNTTIIEPKNKTNTIINKIEIRPNKNYSNLEIEIIDIGENISEEIEKPDPKKLEENVSDINLSYIIYRFLNFAIKINDSYINEDIGSIKINFTVSKEWLDNKSINISNVSMLRYHKNKWEKLETKFIEKIDEKTYLFQCITTGFSTFAVVGSKAIEKGEKYEEPEELSWIWIIGAIIATVAILLIILFKAGYIYIEKE